ncbi:MAG TPA: hypothetical protein VK814_14430 [Acidobacteriaceae bacterium]|nr:hypothetical protein [Acidobacteriaceae bacterium]
MRTVGLLLVVVLPASPLAFSQAAKPTLTPTAASPSRRSPSATPRSPSPDEAA